MATNEDVVCAVIGIGIALFAIAGRPKYGPPPNDYRGLGGIYCAGTYCDKFDELGMCVTYDDGNAGPSVRHGVAYTFTACDGQRPKPTPSPRRETGDERWERKYGWMDRR